MTSPNTIMELQQECEFLREKLRESLKERAELERKYSELERGIEDLVKKLTAGML